MHVIFFTLKSSDPVAADLVSSSVPLVSDLIPIDSSGIIDDILGIIHSHRNHSFNLRGVKSQWDLPRRQWGAWHDDVSEVDV